jgi:hypothetical protein
MNVSIAVRSFVLAVAAATLSQAMAHAQAAPAPQASPSPVQAANVPATPDLDKKLVQDRWGASTGTDADSPKKKSKSQTGQTPNTPGNPQ